MSAFPGSYSLSASRDIREQEERLRAMNPILLESFPLSLEEIFMDEMEGEEQDYADIFK